MAVGVFVRVGDNVGVGVRDGVSVRVGVGVRDGVKVMVGVRVIVGVLVMVGVRVIVGVRVGVRVLVGVEVKLLMLLVTVQSPQPGKLNVRLTLQMPFQVVLLKSASQVTLAPLPLIGRSGTFAVAVAGDATICVDGS